MLYFLIIFAILTPRLLAESNFADEKWSGRLVGGILARKDQFPHMASLRSIDNDHFCGGANIGDRWIVTAAHCTSWETVENMLKLMSVVVSTNNRISGGVPHMLIDIINYPDFNIRTWEYDVSLLHTEKKIVFNAFTASIPIGADFVNEGVSVKVSGWGRTQRTEELTEFLHYINPDTITNEDCKRRLLIARGRVFETSLCTFGRGVGICYHDSGSPLVADGKLIGVVSFTIPCGRGFPDIYARLSSFKDWITEITGIL